MARMKDETKRENIMEAAKILFARQGFFNTSVSDLVRESGFPVGTIYTYFKSKEEIIRTIVEEGWADLYTRLQELVAAPGDPVAKIKKITGLFIPELLNDLDFITILLSEGIVYTRIEEKLEILTDLLISLIKSASKTHMLLPGFNRATLQAAVAVYFLGLMNTVKITRSSAIGIRVIDVLNFLELTIASSLDLEE
jgi:AcrR family transcriptional regulator